MNVGAIKVGGRAKRNARHSPGSFSVGGVRNAVELVVGSDGDFASRVKRGVVALGEGARTESRRHAIAVRN